MEIAFRPTIKRSAPLAGPSSVKFTGHSDEWMRLINLKSEIDFYLSPFKRQPVQIAPGSHFSNKTNNLRIGGKEFIWTTTGDWENEVYTLTSRDGTVKIAYDNSFYRHQSPSSQPASVSIDDETRNIHLKFSEDMCEKTGPQVQNARVNLWTPLQSRFYDFLRNQLFKHSYNRLDRVYADDFEPTPPKRMNLPEDD